MENQSGYELENRIYWQLSKVLDDYDARHFKGQFLKTKLLLAREVRFKNPVKNIYYRYAADFVLFINDKPKCVFEVKNIVSKPEGREGNRNLDLAKSQVEEALLYNDDIQFGAVCLLDTFLLKEKNSKEFIEYTDAASLIGAILPPETNKNKQEDDKGFATGWIKDLYIAICETTSTMRDDEILESLGDKIALTNDGKELGFDELHKDLENKVIWEKLLPPVSQEPISIVRYTTLSSLAATIESANLRLNGIVGMNDPLEVREGELALGGNREINTLPTDEELEEINRTYISSCMTIDKIDTLTAWRLYGDDSKGVCLVFKIDMEKVKSEQNLWVQAVSYADEKDEHKGMEVLREHIKKLEEKGLSFRMHYSSIWKHFFKSKHWAIESEIRILYKDFPETNKSQIHKWLITASDSIFNPYVDFPLNSPNFPVKLVEIILGPNSPEADINVRQISQYIKEKQAEDPKRFNDGPVSVKKSKLNNIYRRK